MSFVDDLQRRYDELLRDKSTNPVENLTDPRGAQDSRDPKPVSECVLEVIELLLGREDLT